MARIEHDDARAELVRTLLEKVIDERFPSGTMMDTIEELLTPEEVPGYVVALQDKIRDETYPSIPLINRLRALLV